MSTKVPPLFLRVAWNRDDKDNAYDFAYGNGYGNGNGTPEKKLEVTNCDHKINLKQDWENGCLVSKTWHYLKQWMGKWICLSKKSGNRIVKRVT